MLNNSPDSLLDEAKESGHMQWSTSELHDASCLAAALTRRRACGAWSVVAQMANVDEVRTVLEKFVSATPAVDSDDVADDVAAECAAATAVVDNYLHNRVAADLKRAGELWRRKDEPELSVRDSSECLRFRARAAWSRHGAHYESIWFLLDDLLFNAESGTAVPLESVHCAAPTPTLPTPPTPHLVVPAAAPKPPKPQAHTNGVLSSPVPLAGALLSIPTANHTVELVIVFRDVSDPWLQLTEIMEEHADGLSRWLGVRVCSQLRAWPFEGYKEIESCQEAVRRVCKNHGPHGLAAAGGAVSGLLLRQAPMRNPHSDPEDDGSDFLSDAEEEESWLEEEEEGEEEEGGEEEEEGEEEEWGGEEEEELESESLSTDDGEEDRDFIEADGICGEQAQKLRLTARGAVTRGRSEEEEEEAFRRTAMITEEDVSEYNSLVLAETEVEQPEPAAPAPAPSQPQQASAAGPSATSSGEPSAAAVAAAVMQSACACAALQRAAPAASSASQSGSRRRVKGPATRSTSATRPPPRRRSHRLRAQQGQEQEGDDESGGVVEDGGKNEEAAEQQGRGRRAPSPLLTSNELLDPLLSWLHNGGPLSLWVDKDTLNRWADCGELPGLEGLRSPRQLASKLHPRAGPDGRGELTRRLIHEVEAELAGHRRLPIGEEQDPSPLVGAQWNSALFWNSAVWNSADVRRVWRAVLLWSSRVVFIQLRAVNQEWRKAVDGRIADTVNVIHHQSTISSQQRCTRGQGPDCKAQATEGETGRRAAATPTRNGSSEYELAPNQEWAVYQDWAPGSVCALWKTLSIEKFEVMAHMQDMYSVAHWDTVGKHVRVAWKHWWASSTEVHRFHVPALLDVQQRFKEITLAQKWLERCADKPPATPRTSSAQLCSRLRPAASSRNQTYGLCSPLLARWRSRSPTAGRARYRRTWMRPLWPRCAADGGREMLLRAPIS